MFRRLRQLIDFWIRFVPIRLKLHPTVLSCRISKLNRTGLRHVLNLYKILLYSYCTVYAMVHKVYSVYAVYSKLDVSQTPIIEIIDRFMNIRRTHILDTSTPQSFQTLNCKYCLNVWFIIKDQLLCWGGWRSFHC